MSAPTRSPVARATVLGVASAAVSIVAAAAVSIAAAAPIPSAAASGSAQESSGLEALSFMTGCWSEEGDGYREQFTPPTENLILGTSRRMVGSRVAGFEFHTITLSDGVPVLTPHPAGVRSDPFAASTLEDGYVVFENLEHDFPQRIIYDGREDDRLIAAIEGDEGGETRRFEFPMRRVPCGGAGAQGGAPPTR